MNTVNTSNLRDSGQSAIKPIFAASWRDRFTRVAGAKNRICAEVRQSLSEHRDLLRRALKEAEELAWQTPYPHLVFPELATEKVRAIQLAHVRPRRTNRADRLQAQLWARH